MGRIYILLWIILEFGRGQIIHWPCRIFLVFFPRKSFLQWSWHRDICPKCLSKCADPSPPDKLFFSSTRLKGSYNNDVTIPKRIRFSDLKKKKKMQKWFSTSYCSMNFSEDQCTLLTSVASNQCPTGHRLKDSELFCTDPTDFGTAGQK